MEYLTCNVKKKKVLRTIKLTNVRFRYYLWQYVAILLFTPNCAMVLFTLNQFTFELKMQQIVFTTAQFSLHISTVAQKAQTRSLAL